MWTLLLSLACSHSDKGGETGAPNPGDTAADTAGDTAPPETAAPVDADGDGWVEDEDCDDGDASVHPEADEVCDGVDQDCDGEVDDGVPNDGAGCMDPGEPDFPDTVDVVHIMARTDVGTYSGSDDSGMEVCPGEGWCFRLDNADWDDLEQGSVDVFATEGVGLPRADIADFTVRTDDGGNRWEPVSFEVALDGERVMCRDDFDLAIGDASDETLEYTTALATLCSSCFDAPLTHGPLVGATGPDRAILWLRTDATRAVEIRVAETESALATAAPVHYGYPAAADDFTLATAIQGLRPETTYAYDLTIAGVRYGPWSFRTAPEPGTPGRYRLAFGSCTKEDDQPIFGPLGAYDPDVFLFLGDNHYGNTDDLGSLRHWYRWAHERDLRADFLAGRSILAVWDDHDFTGNNTDGSEPGKDVALRVFTEYWANPAYGTADTAGVFFQHSFGDVGLFMLDVRYWRALEDSILGDAQEAWLVDALAASDATFKLVVSGSQFTAYNLGETWYDHPEARQRLFDAIADFGIPGVVLLSGDIHRSEFRLVDVDGYDLPELTSSPLANSSRSLCILGTSDEQLACYDAGDSFVGLDIDTTDPDALLTATLFDDDGFERATWDIRRSDLDFAR